MWNVLLKKLNNFCQTISVADSAGSRWCVTANKNGGRKDLHYTTNQNT
jgi:hypothetical protein